MNSIEFLNLKYDIVLNAKIIIVRYRTIVNNKFKNFDFVSFKPWSITIRTL